MGGILASKSPTRSVQCSLNMMMGAWGRWDLNHSLMLSNQSTQDMGWRFLPARPPTTGFHSVHDKGGRGVPGTGITRQVCPGHPEYP